MKIAPLPENEDARLKALARYEVIDTLPEEAFDNITRLASFICQTPISTISLIDETRQWFKSKVGVEGSETTRDLAFCAHAILEPAKLMIVEDTLNDDRFFDSPLVTGVPKIRFYAGYPLSISSGETLGTLCVIDQKPKTLSLEQRDGLCVLAEQVVAQLELRHALRQSKAKVNELKESETERKVLVEKLMESNIELEQFAYVASHDMQEPLRMISSFSHLIGQEYRDRLDRQAQEYLSLVTDSAVRMQNMVSDLLEYARHGNDAAVFMSVDLNKELEFVEQNLSSAIKDARATVTYDKLPTLECNPVQIVRLFQNLIGNGLKYQSAGSHPKVHVSAERTGSDWYFKVVDNGIGMEPEYTTEVFKPFKRLHTWQQYKGTGLGLAVCKKIVTYHGGQIWVTSERGKGSVFHFTLPIQNKCSSPVVGNTNE